ncbi:unnamed protein product [Vitrella brassicaformis CCMP3155]|uniref:Uncharacterized protein n=1 Tax=Vitrella brassicaformis (strain CCMP3155) TaxID=1169540 RepID=A0A0G4FSE5_VITBC|nr:unnamed protein product [Vitrella brassicaformis CCMP3155]|eukprot:CEM17578.1 unnamed protein product [Vitrella brassicaformis CCMP3155]
MSARSRRRARMGRIDNGDVPPSLRSAALACLDEANYMSGLHTRRDQLTGGEPADGDADQSPDQQGAGGLEDVGESQPSAAAPQAGGGEQPLTAAQASVFAGYLQSLQSGVSEAHETRETLESRAAQTQPRPPSPPLPPPPSPAPTPPSQPDAAPRVDEEEYRGLRKQCRRTRAQGPPSW